MAVPTSLRTFLRPEQVLRDVGIRAGWHVVDGGCGAGYYLVPAGRFVGRTGRVVGVDIRSSAVEAAKKRVSSAGVAHSVDVFRADLSRIGSSGLPDNWADLVLLTGILSQADPQGVLREAARLVIPEDGTVVVIEWDQIATPIGPPPEQRIGRTDVLAAAKSAGLSFVAPYTPTPYHYGLLFKRPSGRTTVRGGRD